MTIKPPDVLAILNESRVFAALTQAQRRELSGKARIELYTERTLLTLRGEKPDYIRYIASGGMDLVLSTAEGGYSSLPVFEGRWQSWLGCFGTAPLMYDLWSSAPATYVAFSCRDIKKAIGDNPSALREVIEHVAELTRFLAGWMLSFAAYGPEKRLVYLFAARLFQRLRHHP
jgi:CRP-like cAMP-binding protein